MPRKVEQSRKLQKRAEMMIPGGVISPADFVALNAAVGGLDIDGNPVPQRMDMGPDVARIAYETGRVTGRGALEELAEIFEAGLGNERDALLAQESSLRVALDLVADSKSAPGRREQAALFEEIGSARMQRGDRIAALGAYQRSLEINRDLFGDGRDPQARRDLAAAYDRVAFAELLVHLGFILAGCRSPGVTQIERRKCWIPAAGDAEGKAKMPRVNAPAGVGLHRPPRGPQAQAGTDL